MLNLFEDESWRAVAHDFAAMLLNYNYPPAQGWFDEGLAEYFSSIRVDNKQVELGSDPELLPSASQELGQCQRDSDPPKSSPNCSPLRSGSPCPTSSAMKHDTSARNEGGHHTLYYAESWIVMHYLLHEQKLPETGAYFNLVLNQHVPVEDAIQKAYGMSSAQLEQAVKDYFHSQTALLTAARKALDTLLPRMQRPARAYRFPVPVGPDDSAITSKPLPEADARALYFEVAIRIPERRDRGLQGIADLATAPTAALTRSLEAKNSKQKNPAKMPTNSPPMRSATRSRIASWPGTTSSMANSRRPQPNSRTLPPSIRATCGALLRVRAEVPHRAGQPHRHPGPAQHDARPALRARVVSRTRRRLRSAGGRPQRRRRPSRRAAGRARRHQSEPAR